MSTRSTVLIVLGAALILGMGLAAVTVVGRGLQYLRREMTSEAARIQFVTAWRPPAALEPTLVFPDTVLGYRRALATAPSSPRPNDPDSDLGVSPLRETYERSARASIEVFACQVDAEQTGKVLARAEGVFKARSGKTSAMRSSVQMHERLQLTSSDPAEQVEIWVMHGWLFYFRSTAAIDPGFIRAYLSGIRGRAGGV